MTAQLSLKDRFTSLLISVRNQIRFRFKLSTLLFSNKFSHKSATGSDNALLSLTSHSRRLKTLWIPIECIAIAKHRPRRIIVWLSKDLEHSALPPRLKRLRTRGVEFYFVDDVGPHTKYFYALDECISAKLPLVTIDDDCVYSSWHLRRLLEASISSPDVIIGYRVRRIKLSSNGSPLPYSKWDFCNSPLVHPLNFITGVSGAFYPLSFIRLLALHGKAFVDYCLKQDDVWINYIAAKHEVPVRQLDSSPWDFPLICDSQRISLWSSNEVGGNDLHIQQTYDSSTLARLKVLSANFSD